MRTPTQSLRPVPGGDDEGEGEDEAMQEADAPGRAGPRSRGVPPGVTAYRRGSPFGGFTVARWVDRSLLVAVRVLLCWS
jgi:hypothetical protein